MGIVKQQQIKEWEKEPYDDYFNHSDEDDIIYEDNYPMPESKNLLLSKEQEEALIAALRQM